VPGADLALGILATREFLRLAELAHQPMAQLALARLDRAALVLSGQHRPVARIREPGAQ
jgi:hypothetical protein